MSDKKAKNHTRICAKLKVGVRVLLAMLNRQL